MYAEGVLRAHVARVILLFYLTPVWSTLLARVMLGEPITRRRMLTLLFGLSGLLVILDTEQANPLPRNVGEWLGLAAGFAWGLAMVHTRRARAYPLADKVALQFVLRSRFSPRSARFPAGANGRSPRLNFLTSAPSPGCSPSPFYGTCRWCG